MPNQDHMSGNARLANVPIALLVGGGITGRCRSFAVPVVIPQRIFGRWVEQLPGRKQTMVQLGVVGRFGADSHLTTVGKWR